MFALYASDFQLLGLFSQRLITTFQPRPTGKNVRIDFVHLYQLDKCLDLIDISWVLEEVLLQHLGLKSAFHAAATKDMSAYDIISS